jgi:hypothetical protein
MRIASQLVALAGMCLDDIEVLSLQMANDILESRIKMRENDMQMSWERTRWLAATLLAPHAKKGKHIKGQDLIRFAWDEVAEKPKMDEETMKRVMKFWDDNPITMM